MTTSVIDGEENSSVSIPVDVIIDILSRLPAKSIARWRCMSKLWTSILRREYFTELFLTRSLHRPQILFSLEKGNKWFFLSSPQLQNPSVNSSPITANHNANFSLYGYTSRICLPVHGLICLTHKEMNETLAVVCNPSTGGFLNLPILKTPISVKCFLGYDPIEKIFKVLSVPMKPMFNGSLEKLETRVLTLGTDQEPSWRLVECSINHVRTDVAICINGVLYYLSEDLDSEDPMIVCFDVRLEKFRFITAMEDFIGAVHRGTLINYNGKLSALVYEQGRCFVSGDALRIELWILKDSEKNECSKHTYVLPASWRDVVGTNMLRFVGITCTNEIVLVPCFPRYAHFYIFYYNIDKQTMRRVQVLGMESFKGHFVHTFLDHVENVKLLHMF